MLEMMRSPPAPFASVIRRHFWLKKDEITAQIDGWIKEMEADCKLCLSHTPALLLLHPILFLESQH